MDVFFYDKDEENILDGFPFVDTKHVSISEIEALIELVRKYGYINGSEVPYEFAYVKVEFDGIYIYIKKTNEKE